MKFTNQDELHTYLTNQSKICKVGDFCDKNNILKIPVWLRAENGKKTPCFLKKYDTKKKDSCNPLSYPAWNKQEVQEHNDFIMNDSYYSKKVDTWIVLPNNTNMEVGKNEENNIHIIDCDSKEELWKLYQNGFPVLTTPYTLSSTKKLPHFYIKCNALYERILGSDLKPKREIDLLYWYAYEKMSRSVRGSEEIPLIPQKDLSDYLNMTQILSKGSDCPFEEGRKYAKQFYSRRLITARKETKQPAAVRIFDDGMTLRSCIDFSMGDVKVKPTWETISFDKIKKILEVLPVEKYDMCSGSFKLIRCIVSMLTPMNNPTDYILMIDEFMKKSPKYKGCWFNDTAKKFAQFINEDSYEGLRADWLYNQLKEVNKEMWIDMAFDKSRDLDIKAFAYLKKDDAVKVFNRYVSVLGGNRCEFISWTHRTKEYAFKTEAQIRTQFKNLYYSGFKKVLNADGEIELSPKEKKFIDEWLDSKYRSQYNGGVVFQPNLKETYDDQFNLFTPFEIDKMDDYNDEMEELEEWEVEEIIQPILQHLRYLSGDDMTTEVYEFTLKYIAHLFKFPHILPRVCIAWISNQGVGKNIMLDFLASLMGDKYYCSTSHIESVVGNFNEGIRGRFLVNINEVEQAHKYKEKLKELQTERRLETRQKCKDNLTIENYIRMFLTTNNLNGFHADLMERRQVIIQCSGITTTDHFKHELDYFPTLIKCMSSLRVKKAFLYYCRNYVNVEGNYNFPLHRPLTQCYRDIQSVNMPYVVKFITYMWKNNMGKENNGRVPAFSQKELKELYDDFQKSEGGSDINISSTSLLHKIKHHTIKHEDDKTWLEANPHAVFINPPRKKQLYFQLCDKRVENFFKVNGLVFEKIDFIASSEDETDDEC